MNFYLYAMLKSAQDRFSITGELKKKKKIIKEAEKDVFLTVAASCYRQRLL